MVLICLPFNALAFTLDSIFKGLGEMSYQKLAESTLHPDGNRTLIRYTLEDAKEELEAIREYESDMKKILSHIGKVSRTELMGI